MATIDLLKSTATRANINPALATLQGCMASLPERDRAFASDLISQSMQRLLSPKQIACVESLIARAKAPTIPPMQGLGSIVAMLDKASQTLKAPILRFEADGIRYRLGRAGSMSRQPGSITVTTDERAFADRIYFGRINTVGEFEPHHKHGLEYATAIGRALKAFAESPAEQARLYGQRFGRCCFCSLELTNKASIVAGYGPICAEKWGLPWGGV